MVFRQFDLWPHLTARENEALALKLVRQYRPPPPVGTPEELVSRTSEPRIQSLLQDYLRRVAWTQGWIASSLIERRSTSKASPVTGGCAGTSVSPPRFMGAVPSSVCNNGVSGWMV